MRKRYREDSAKLRDRARGSTLLPSERSTLFRNRRDAVAVPANAQLKDIVFDVVVRFLSISMSTIRIRQAEPLAFHPSLK
jgi:hypothetical protein